VLMADKLADWPDQVKAKWPLDTKGFGRFSGRMDAAFGKMILDAMEARGWTVAELSRRSGVSYDTINKFKHRPHASTKADSARKLCEALDLEWPGDEHYNNPSPNDLVPIYDIEVSAGNGSIVPDFEAEVGQLAFPPGYLRHITSAPVRNLAIVTVKGDSMSPTLREGDVVMIDTTKRNLGFDGLFVLRMDGALHVKRVNRGGQSGVVRILSDNRESYPATERCLDQVEAVGKVLWYGRKE
jgi:phage repressor protein C with HTH and peptisase S24 domain